MLNNNQNLNNINLNVDGIELGQAKEVQYVPQPTAPVANNYVQAPAQAQVNTRYLYPCQVPLDKQKNKYMTKVFIAIIMIFMIVSSICFVVNDRNVQQNKNSIELLKTEVDNQSSNQRDHQGDPVDTLTFFVEDNMLYSSKSTDPIFDFSQLKGLTGEKGENGITPNLYVEDDRLYSSTSSKPLIDFGKFKGENGLAPKLYVEGNKLYSSTSPEPIFNLDELKGGTGEKGNNGKDGQPGHSPEIDIHTEGGNLKIDVDGKE